MTNAFDEYAAQNNAAERAPEPDRAFLKNCAMGNLHRRLERLNPNYRDLQSDLCRTAALLSDMEG